MPRDDLRERRRNAAREMYKVDISLDPERKFATYLIEFTKYLTKYTH